MSYIIILPKVLITIKLKFANQIQKMWDIKQNKPTEPVVFQLCRYMA